MKTLVLNIFAFSIFSLGLALPEACATCTDQLIRLHNNLTYHVDFAIESNPSWNEEIAQDCKTWLISGGDGGLCLSHTTKWQGMKSVLSKLADQLNQACLVCSCPSQRKMLKMLRAGGATHVIDQISSRSSRQSELYTPQELHPAQYKRDYQDEPDIAI